MLIIIIRAVKTSQPGWGMSWKKNGSTQHDLHLDESGNNQLGSTHHGLVGYAVDSPKIKNKKFEKKIQSTTIIN